MKPIAPDAEQRPPDILVVDDIPANLQLLTGMLKEHGYRVRPVPSGPLALQAIRKRKPDLILLDINMPDMNGYEVCEHLKADATLKEIPVLFISALDETMDKVKAFAAGGVDYVTKPFQFEEVEARVRTHLQLRRLQVELEKQNLQLRESYVQLKNLEGLRDNLIHMIVHDLRSPLTGITGCLEILETRAGKKLDSDELKNLSGARSAGLLLVEMVSSLLDVNRLEQGQMPLNVTEADLDGLVQEALKSLGSLTGHVEFHYQKQPLPVVVRCDKGLIVRVIANLVANAVKFTPKGGKVVVSVERHGEGAKLSVADTGYGIPREYHEKIFEKFGQVEARRQGGMYSTGLGLTFCKLAVEAHGGEIGLESAVDKGSTFWFTLPPVTTAAPCSSPAPGAGSGLGAVLAGWALMLSLGMAVQTAQAESAPPVEISFSAVVHPQDYGPMEILEPNPNTAGAVGPEHAVTILATTFQIQDRTGGVLRTEPPLQFWTRETGWEFQEPLGKPYDHKVLYDKAAERWIITAGANSFSTNSYLLIAVSQTANPLEGWFRYRFVADPARKVWPDFPVTGFNRKWVAVHASMNSIVGEYVRGNLYVLDKARLYANQSPGLKVFELDWADFTVIPATTQDPTQDDLYLLHLNSTDARPRVGKITGPVGAETLALGVATTQVAEAWSVQGPGEENFAPQYGVTNRIWINHPQLYSCLYRDGSLWMAHTVFLPADAVSFSAVQWWQIGLDGAVLQRGRVEDPAGSVFYAMPSISVNRYGDALIGYAAFSTGFYARAEYSFHAASDPPGTLRAPRILKAGENPYVRTDVLGRNRWGATSITVVDPADDIGFWTLQEYAAAPTHTWGTWWGRIDPQQADVAIGILEFPSEIEAGVAFEARVAVSNSGPSAAGDVILTGSLAAGLGVLSVRTTQGSVAWSVTNTVTVSLGTLAAGATAVVTVSLVGLQPAAQAIGNWRVTLAARDPAPGNNSVSAGIQVQACGEPRLVVRAVPEPALAGGELRYHLSLLNGPTPHSAVTVTNVFPSNVDFISALGSQGSVATDNGVLTWTVGDLAANDSVTLDCSTLAVRPGRCTNVVAVSANDPGVGLRNLRGEAVSRILRSADLGLALTANPLTAVEGGTVEFTVRVVNQGSSAVESVVVSALLPATLDWLATEAGQGAYSPNTGIWEVGTLPAGSSTTLRLRAAVRSGTSGQSLGCVASVQAASLPDPVSSNDQARADVTVSGADLQAQVSGQPNPVAVYSNVTYTIAVSNSGPGSPTNVEVAVSVSSNLTILSVSAGNGVVSVDRNSASYRVGTLPNGGSASVTVLTRCDATGIVYCTVQARSDQADPETSNSTARAAGDALDFGRVWINEADYDDADSNEWVELCGEAGLSLDGYALMAYSSDGAAVGPLDLQPANWTFADEGDGFGFFVVGRVAAGDGTSDFTPAGWDDAVLPNTDGSSIRLVHKASVPVNEHFVDYGGDNPGTMEDQIANVSDSGDPHTSIYLSGGPASGFRGFTWAGVNGATPGAVNAGQTLQRPQRLRYTLEIRSDHGAPDPVAGLYSLPGGIWGAGRVNSTDTQGLTQYVSAGWTLTGVAPSSGSGQSLVLILTNNAVLTWDWKTRYWLDVANGPHGRSDVRDGWFDAGSNLVLTAQPYPNYRFSGWSGDTNGCVADGDRLTAPMNGPRLIRSEFVPEVYSLRVESAHGFTEPAAGRTYNHEYGKILINACSPFETLGSTQYMCTGWTLVGQDPASGLDNSMGMVLTSDAVLTWSWVTRYWLAARTEGPGVLDLSSGWVEAGQPVVLTALPGPHQRLQGWHGDTQGTVAVGSSLRFTMDQPRVVTASFIPETVQLTVRSDHGAPIPPVGVYAQDYGSLLQASVNPVQLAGDTQYVCTGWTLTGHDQITGDQTALSGTITNDAQFTWQWATNFQFRISATPGGTVDVKEDWVAARSSVEVTATADAGWRFAAWGGATNGCAVWNYRIRVPMDAARQIQAVFAQGSNQPPRWSVAPQAQEARVGQPLQFRVTAVDPDGAAPVLQAVALPQGAGFADLGNGSGDFAWTPSVPADVTVESLGFLASDGLAATPLQVGVHVRSFDITSPTNGFVWTTGAELPIAWAGAWPLGSVDVDLWQGTNRVAALAEGTAATTAVAQVGVEVPPGLEPGADYWVGVACTPEPRDSDISDPFTLLPLRALGQDLNGGGGVWVLTLTGTASRYVQVFTSGMTWKLRDLDGARIFAEKEGASVAAVIELDPSGIPRNAQFIRLPVAGLSFRAFDGYAAIVQFGAGSPVYRVVFGSDWKARSYQQLTLPIPGLIARSMEGHRVLAQIGDGGPIYIGDFIPDWTMYATIRIKGVPAKGLIARSLAGDRILVQAGRGGAASLWRLAADGTVTDIQSVSGPVAGRTWVSLDWQ